MQDDGFGDGDGGVEMDADDISVGDTETTVDDNFISDCNDEAAESEHNRDGVNFDGNVGVLLACMSRTQIRFLTHQQDLYNRSVSASRLEKKPNCTTI